MDGADAAGNREVGADAVGFYALIEHSLTDVEAEVGATVGGVEPDAALMGLPGFGDQIAVGVQHAAGIGGEEVGDDVARLHDGEQFADDLGGIALFGVADVNHQGDAGFFSGPLGEAGHLHAHYLESRRNHARLDAADGAVAFFDDLYGAFQVDAAGRENVGSGGESGAADVQEGDDLGGVAGDDVGRETAVGIASAAASIHHGGYASAHAANIGVDTVAVHAFVDVGVEVDEAGGDVFAFYFDNARCLISSDVGGDGGDFAVFDGYVERAVQPLRGVDNSAALDQQVIHELVPSGGIGELRFIDGWSGYAVWDFSG